MTTPLTFEQDDQFRCHLHCGRCWYQNPNTGLRCKNRVCIGTPVCWIHTKKIWGVQIKDSTIADAGKGLFATRDFATDEEIVPYFGKKITEACLDERYDYKTAPYAIGNDDMIVDSACVRGIASMSNGLFNQRTGTSRSMDLHNATIEFNDAEEYFFLQASKPINKGDEIFAYYGRGYRLTDDHRTKRKRGPDTRPC
jgi:hypothetical protein